MILENYIILSASLFCIGLYGLMTSANIIRAFMSLELIFNAINLNFVAFSNFMDGQEIKGQVISLFIIAIAAAEAAIGLALILTVYRNRQTTDINNIDWLKW